ncbi:hypothetical protein D3C71_19100 [compost metagenome]
MKSRFSAGALVALVGLVLVLLVGAVGVVSYISAFNFGNRMEQTIKATYENNQNILTAYSQKVLEAAQVTDMARDDIIKVTREAISGRYGAEGSKAVFQMLTEQNPQVSEKLYVKLQQLVEAGRDEFKTNQTRLIDQKTVYNTALGSFWRGTWLGVAGYPKANLDDYKVIITDGVAQTFKTGRESAPLQLRPQAN